MNLLNDIRKNLVNLPGFRSGKKIIVFESDDWGSIRMSSKEAVKKLKNLGLKIDNNYFTAKDILENHKDLDLLFNVLASFSDIKGNHPVITANSLVANPDFAKIKVGGFLNYYFETFPDTYKRYSGDSSTLEVWKKGIEQHLLWPQFHGREHVNVVEWLRALRTGNPAETAAFELECILGLENYTGSKRPDGYMAAFSFESAEEKTNHEKILSEGLNIFERIFGFRSSSFIASCGVHPIHLDKILKIDGVKYIQGGKQYMEDKHGNLNPINRFWGYRNIEGQIFWRRNATFEPSRKPDFDWVNSVMAEIAIAFRWGKPAVINSHRVNYVGSISADNRDNTLRLLNMLLTEILKKYPDVEFMSSDQLGDLMAGIN